MLLTSSTFGIRSAMAFGLWLAATAGASAQTMAPAPEAATGRTAKTLGTAQRYMAAAANPLAAAAGREILRAGGSATDAAIAIQLVLNLVEPQSSGIGGGAFFVYWDEAGRQLTTLDGRETAPKAAKPERFLGADGKPKPVGAILKNPAFAATLRAIAGRGADAFYEGAIAEDIVATVTGHATNPGDISLDDLKAYRVEERAPLCGRYRAYTLCGMGPPSSGAVAVQQILGMLETKDIARVGAGAEAAHWFAEAGKLAFADRALYLGDPAFVSVPTFGLIDEEYIRERAKLISPDKAMAKASAGTPPNKRAFLFAPSEGVENGTSHISVIDAAGNAVSMTTTIEDGFGSRLMTKGGFLLNNELTDFSFAPSEDGKPVANRVEPGKRPRSSMAPTIVFDAFGRLYAVTGSPGGSQIIGYVAKTLVALLDWKMDPQRAVDLANFGNRNGPTELEKSSEAEAWKAALEAKGHEVRLIEMTSGIQAIVKTPEGYLGGADGRREGVAIGD